MSKTRSISVLFILLSSAISIVWGVLLNRGSGTDTFNYRAVYYGARCIIAPHRSLQSERNVAYLSR